MYNRFLFLIIFLFLSAFSYSQRIKPSFRDKGALGEVFSRNTKNYFDTSSVEYKEAKKSVFEYCIDKVNFPLDSTLISMVCYGFSDVHWDASDSAKKVYEEYNLKYEFRLAFRAGSGIRYSANFNLDSVFKVVDAPLWLCQSNSDKQVWVFKPWKEISKLAKAHNGGWIKPIDWYKMGYSMEHHRYIYIVNQGVNSKTKMTKDTETSKTFMINQLWIDASTGEILKEFVRPAVLQYHR